MGRNAGFAQGNLKMFVVAVHFFQSKWIPFYIIMYVKFLMFWAANEPINRQFPRIARAKHTGVAQCTRRYRLIRKSAAGLTLHLNHAKTFCSQTVYNWIMISQFKSDYDLKVHAKLILCSPVQSVVMKLFLSAGWRAMFTISRWHHCVWLMGYVM